MKASYIWIVLIQIGVQYAVLCKFDLRTPGSVVTSYAVEGCPVNPAINENQPADTEVVNDLTLNIAGATTVEVSIADFKVDGVALQSARVFDHEQAENVMFDLTYKNASDHVINVCQVTVSILDVYVHAPPKN